MCASACTRTLYSAGAYTSARVDVLNVGVLAPQLVPARRRINAVRSNVGTCSLAGKSPTIDVQVQISFCLSVVQVKRCRHSVGFT